MFKFLKEKLFGKVEEISEEVDKTAKTVEISPEEEKKGIFSKIKGIFTKEETVEKPEKTEEKKAEPVKKERPKKEKKSRAEKPVEEKIEDAKEHIEKTIHKIEEKKLEIREEIKHPTHHEHKEAEKAAAPKDEKRTEHLKEDAEPEQKKSLFQKITQKIFAKVIDQDTFDKVFWELELILLENNVALEVVDKIREEMKAKLVDKPIPRTQIKDSFLEALQSVVDDVLINPKIDLVEEIKNKSGSDPYVVCFVGINGSGKTTTIAKVVQMLKDNGITSVLSASDTFRAAAIQQLEEHANKLNTKLIKHDYGSDPAAVAFDAVKYAKAHSIKSVLIDTAGRLHTNTNLMDEMKKVIKVAKPNLVLFIGESITGNDCLEQIKEFNKFVDIDGVILTKADVDEKGGTALSLSYVTKKPILYLGVGQRYTDLIKFDKAKIEASLFG